MADYAAGLIADKGGPESMSSAELRMVELAQLARGCALLAMAEAAKGDGLMAKGSDLAGTLARFLNVERQCLIAIGLERRAKPVPSFREVMASTTTPAEGEKLVGVRPTGGSGG